MAWPRTSPLERGSRGLRQFARALEALMERLARMLVADGEGATKLVTVTVRGAASRRDAMRWPPAAWRTRPS